MTPTPWNGVALAEQPSASILSTRSPKSIGMASGWPSGQLALADIGKVAGLQIPPCKKIESFKV